VTAASFTGSICVVTGGCGFIGSNLVHALRAVGASVRVIDAMVDGHGGDQRNLAGLNVPVVVADIGDPSVADLVRDADVVFNIAGQVSHTESMRDPLRDLKLNAMSHAAFLETVRAVNRTVRIVQTSTRQVYGRAGDAPVDETHETQPVDVNGVAKLAGEQLHLVYNKAYGMATTCLRLTNVYGPRQRLTSNELGFLPVFIRKALLGESIEIFGDGQQRRDLLFVDDVVDAIIAASADSAIGQVFNVGHHRDYSLIEVARVIVESARSDMPPRLVAWPPEHRSIDIGSFHTDGRKIVDQLGWNAHVDLQQGADTTVAFYREHPWYLSTT
jgi:UDP-glucose 4-epimerase